MQLQNLENSGQLWRQYPHVEDDTSVAIATTVTSSVDPEREHEERRILERFASFGRPATPKNRRRNKRKGSDSPRLHTQTETEAKTEAKTDFDPKIETDLDPSDKPQLHADGNNLQNPATNGEFSLP